MNVSEGNIQGERELSDLEKLGLLLMDLMDIEQQKTAVYGQEKAKKAEANVIRDRIRDKAQKGRTIFDKEG